MTDLPEDYVRRIPQSVAEVTGPLDYQVRMLAERVMTLALESAARGVHLENLGTKLDEQMRTIRDQNVAIDKLIEQTQRWRGALGAILLMGSMIGAGITVAIEIVFRSKH